MESIFSVILVTITFVFWAIILCFPPGTGNTLTKYDYMRHMVTVRKLWRSLIPRPGILGLKKAG
ncbi:MAG: hypothetical protein RDV48_02920 [Candidatus Eremiobacteraeota bacterium]|nr:hypothetical protein [Candidatus Eremiobacteraeota bacterium]